MHKLEQLSKTIEKKESLSNECIDEFAMTDSSVERCKDLSRSKLLHV